MLPPFSGQDRGSLQRTDSVSFVSNTVPRKLPKVDAVDSQHDLIQMLAPVRPPSILLYRPLNKASLLRGPTC
ncbi:hypothetical protein CLCR_07854 [Cladophialophora carrionii]|uniref:Uncharacterized protein n=1 Tax=Cladophialophora carrionii TaxID=86049 RepID=A0A1C1CPE4_9EURO|nr:hypothetical protein CLCR_07854 [Cladophialophora carrionii]